MSTPVLTFAERYEQMRESVAPAVQSPEKPESAAAVVPASEEHPVGDETHKTPAEGTEAAVAAPAPAKEQPPAPPKNELSESKARIQQLERDLAEARKPQPSPPAAPPQAAAPPAPAETPKKPQVGDFQTYEAYLEELSSWNVDRRLEAKQAQDAQAEVTKTLRGKFDAAAAKHPDFHEVLKKNIPINAATDQALRESDVAGEVAYYLATHEDEARQLAAMSPVATIKRIAQLEQSFSVAAPAPAGSKPATEPAARRVSGAPKPPETVKPSSIPPESGLEDISKLPQKERMKRFTEIRAKQGQRDAKRLVALG